MMPNIREYTNPIDKLNISNEGAAAVARGGNALAQAGETAGRMGSIARDATTSAGTAIGRSIARVGAAGADVYEQHYVQPQISKGAALLTGLQNEFNRDLQSAMSADVNDTTVGSKFKENVLTPRLEKFLDGFTTTDSRRWAEKQVLRMREHYDEKVMTIEAQRAGHALAGNITTIANNAAAAVSTDPDSMKFTIDTAVQSIQDIVRSSPNLTPDMAAKAEVELTLKVKNTIAESTLMAVARRSPEEGLKLLASGKLDEYLSGTDRKQMETYIRGQQQVLKAERRAEIIFQRDQRKEAANSAAVKIMTDNFVVQPDGKIKIDPKFFDRTLNELGRMPNVDKNLVNSMLAAGRSIVHEYERKTAVRTDPETYQDFTRRMFVPEEEGGLALQEVMEARAKDKLSLEDFAFLKDAVNKEIRNPRDVADEKEVSRFLSEWKSQITDSSLTKLNRDGDAMFANYSRDVRKIVKDQRAQGRRLDEILEYARRIIPFYVKPDLTSQSIQNRARGIIMIPDSPIIPDSFNERFGPSVPAAQRRQENETPSEWVRRRNAK